MIKGKIARLDKIDKPYGSGIIISETGEKYIFRIGLFAGLIDKNGIRHRGEISPNDLKINDLVEFLPPSPKEITALVKEIWLSKT